MKKETNPDRHHEVFVHLNVALGTKLDKEVKLLALRHAQKYLSLYIEEMEQDD